MIKLIDKHYGVYYIPLHRVKELHPNERMSDAGAWEPIISVVLEDENLISTYSSKAARDIALAAMTAPSAEPSIDNIELLDALEEIRTLILALHTKIDELLPKPEL